MILFNKSLEHLQSINTGSRVLALRTTTMTKKDYELIARVFNREITKVCIKEEESYITNGHQQGSTANFAYRTEKHKLHVLADKLATELKADNRDFDTDKFMNQAGVLNNQFDIESGQYRA